MQMDSFSDASVNLSNFLGAVQFAGLIALTDSG